MSSVFDQFEPSAEKGKENMGQPVRDYGSASSSLPRGNPNHLDSNGAGFDTKSCTTIHPKNGHSNECGLDKTIPYRARKSLELLRDAFHYARESSSDLWDFALELDQIQRPGISISDLRWLARMDLVQYAIEVTDSNDGHRRFQRSDNLAFNAKTCFVMTERGLSVLQALNRAPTTSALITGQANGHHAARIRPNANQLKPIWDNDRRELRFAGKIIKHFKWKAVNQERVLIAFEEDGWPDCIDDPLPPSDNVSPKRRLHDTIKCLNRNQLSGLIRFHGNGNGEGVVWRRVITMT